MSPDRSDVWLRKFPPRYHNILSSDSRIPFADHPTISIRPRGENVNVDSLITSGRLLLFSGQPCLDFASPPLWYHSLGESHRWFHKSWNLFRSIAISFALCLRRFCHPISVAVDRFHLSVHSRPNLGILTHCIVSFWDAYGCDTLTYSWEDICHLLARLIWRLAQMWLCERVRTE
jgi:hypothetical protein